MSMLQNTTMSNAAMAGSLAEDYLRSQRKSDETNRSQKSSGTDGAVSVNKTKVSGKTVGEPQLSDKAAKYYEQLKKKYSNLDFILVSRDKKQQASAQAGSFANPSKMVVLIDEDKIERMAEDENYRKQYEGIIANAQNGLKSLGSSIAGSGAKVKGYGMTVNDGGTASYFAVLEKSNAAQRERIEKKSAEKKEAKKAEAKKEAKEARQERLEKSRNDKKADRREESWGERETVTITASSEEELLRKIQDYVQGNGIYTVQTEEEKSRGQSIDFSV